MPGAGLNIFSCCRHGPRRQGSCGTPVLQEGPQEGTLWSGQDPVLRAGGHEGPGRHRWTFTPFLSTCWGAETNTLRK